MRRKWQPPEMRQPYKSKVNPSPFREVDLPLRRKRPMRRRRHWGIMTGYELIRVRRFRIVLYDCSLRVAKS